MNADQMGWILAPVGNGLRFFGIGTGQLIVSLFSMNDGQAMT
jgi:hypothetical protein